MGGNLFWLVGAWEVLVITRGAETGTGDGTSGGRKEKCRKKGDREYEPQEPCFGLASEGVQVGDEIWALEGGRVPFVLRPASGLSFTGTAAAARAREMDGHDIESDTIAVGAERSHYCFVGACYVKGVMDGEAVVGLEVGKGTRVWLV